jgi:hypothetical protein
MAGEYLRLVENKKLSFRIFHHCKLWSPMLRPVAEFKQDAEPSFFFTLDMQNLGVNET